MLFYAIGCDLFLYGCNTMSKKINRKRCPSHPYNSEEAIFVLGFWVAFLTTTLLTHPISETASRRFTAVLYMGSFTIKVADQLLDLPDTLEFQLKITSLPTI